MIRPADVRQSCVGNAVRRDVRTIVALLCASALLAACSSSPKVGQSSRPTGSSAVSKPDAPGSSRGKGGYYMDDGPMDTSGVNLDAVPDAVPAVEPLHRFANRPYNVFGNDYVPQTSIELPYDQTGMGSWYGRKFHGQKTSSGEIYDMFAMTAAHPTLPIPSYARVSNPRNGRSVIVRVNDRGPFLHNRVIDLSYVAAHRLGYVQQGSAEVRVEKLTPVLIAQLRNGRAAPVVATSTPTSPVAAAAPVAVAAVPAAAAAVLATVPAEASLPLPSAAEVTVVPDVVRPSAVASSVEAIDTPRADRSGSASSAPAVGGFFLQLGAFSVEDNARAFLSRLSLEFSEQLPNLQIVRREPLFRLLAGPYRSREEAQVASRRLKDLASVAAVIVTP